MASDRRRAHLLISGTVQGVFYRASTESAATDCGVDGWVRNLPDGRVEAVFEGPEEAVEDMIDWCHDGSARASVSEVDVSYESPEGLAGFEIRK